MKTLGDESYKEAYAQFRDNYKKAARFLGVSPATLIARYTKIGLREKSSHGGRRHGLTEKDEQKVIDDYNLFCRKYSQFYTGTRQFQGPVTWIARRTGHIRAYITNVLKKHKLEFDANYWHELYEKQKEREMKGLYKRCNGDATKAAIAAGYCGNDCIVDHWKRLGLKPKDRRTDLEKRLAEPFHRQRFHRQSDSSAE